MELTDKELAVRWCNRKTKIEKVEIDWDDDEMKDINYDMRNGVLITPYQIICLLRENIGSQDNNV